MIVFFVLCLVPSLVFADPGTLVSLGTYAASSIASASTGTILGTIASLGGAAIGAIGQRNAGAAADQSARSQAAQLERRAGQERASAQREAAEQIRRANIAQSNLTAAAASSGGGVADPTVLNLAGGLAKQGRLNAMTALFEGEERARGSEFQAVTTRAEGKAARRAGNVGAFTTIAGSVGSSLLDKYGSNLIGASDGSSYTSGGKKVGKLYG